MITYRTENMTMLTNQKTRLKLGIASQEFAVEICFGDNFGSIEVCEIPLDFVTFTSQS